MTGIIEIRDLTKRFGRVTAVAGLTLSIDEGEVFGFIGPNGAGKTTTMRMLTTLLQPSSGEALIAGKSIVEEPRAVRAVIGYMPDFFGVYEDMKVWEYLDFFAACYDVTPATRTAMIGDLLALVDLGHRRDDSVESLSRGMKQRLCLARTLAHDPQVLILDEPASGLDPRARIEIRELLRELQKMGKTIFFSSHILSEVADVCSSVGIIEEGRLVVADDVAGIRRRMQAHRILAVRVLGDTAGARSALAADDNVVGVSAGSGGRLDGRLRVEFSGDDLELHQLLARLLQQGVQVVDFAEQESDLEEVFMAVTTGLGEQPERSAE